MRYSWVTPLWMFLFFLLPLFYVLVLSVLSKGVYGGIEMSLSLRALDQAFSFKYFEIAFRTFVMAFVTATSCTFLGAFCAWFVKSRTRQTQFFWLGLFILPFLINSLIRLHSLQAFMGHQGPFSFWADYTHSQSLMYAGLILTYLPFAILPLMAAFQKWDASYFEAAQDLGADLRQNFLWVIWPWLKAPLSMAFFIVFIPCLGEFLAPEILSGSKKMYWGQLIAEAYLKWRDWPLGSAFGLMLIAVLLLFFFLQRKKT